MATWGDYQSVIQLSVALNTAYAALATYLGNDVHRERQSIGEVIDAVPGAKERIPAVAKALSALRQLDGELTKIEQDYESAINSRVRPACLAGALIGMILLVVSSAYYGCSITGWWQVFSCALLLPFVGGVAYAANMAVRTRRRVASRPELERQLERHLSNEK